MNPFRALKRKLVDKVRAVARDEARAAVDEALPVMRRIAEFAASDPEGRQSAHDLTKDPLGNAARYAALRDRFARTGVPVRDVRVDPVAFARWMEAFAPLVEYNRPLGDVAVEKCLEHYLSHAVLDPLPGQVHIDVAASRSPYAGLLRQLGVEAYRLDLAFPPGKSGYDLGVDATDTGLPDGFADGMALHCSLECFAGDADVRFFAEAARLLKPGGRCIIVPLYVGETHAVTASPYCADGASPETADPEGVFLWRDDQYAVPFSRTYAPETFAARVHGVLPRGVKGHVRYAANIPELMAAHPGQRLYSHFQYVVEKSA